MSFKLGDIKEMQILYKQILKQYNTFSINIDNYRLTIIHNIDDNDILLNLIDQINITPKIKEHKKLKLYYTIDPINNFVSANDYASFDFINELFPNYKKTKNKQKYFVTIKLEQIVNNNKRK